MLRNKPAFVFTLVLLHLLVSLLEIKGQFAERDFIRYSVKEGLSDNTVNCIAQDDQGYIWIGTDAGLNRFDGHQFKKFYQSTEPLGLLSGSITRMRNFGSHHFGINSRGGFQLLHTPSYVVKNFVIPDSTAFHTYLNSTWDAVALGDGSFAVTTAAGFYVFDASGKVILRHDAYHLKDIGQRRILYGRDILSIGQGQYLVYVNEKSMAHYDHVKKEYRDLDPKDSTWSAFAHPNAQPNYHWVLKQQINPEEFIFIPSTSNTIVYYHHGLKKRVESPIPAVIHYDFNWASKVVVLNDTTLIINCRTKGFYRFHLNRATGYIRYDETKYLPDYEILCPFVDKDNRIWAGTTQGVLQQKLQPPVITSYLYSPEEGDVYTGGFTTLYKYKDKLYAGRFSRTKGLAIIDARTMQLIREIDLFGKDSEWNEIRSIEMYHPDTLWIGTNSSLVWFDTKSGRYGKLLDEKKYPWFAHFYAVLGPPREDGYAWMVSVLNGKVVRYHIPTRTFTLFTSKTNPALPFDRVKSVAYDAYGDVWIGGHSLARWNNLSQTFDTLITAYGGANKYNDDIVTFTADTEGSLWVHNASNGLLEYRIKEKKFVAYSTKNGLPSDVIQCISPVIDGKVWVAGNYHLTLFDTRTKQFTVYDQLDGMPDQKPSGRKMFYDGETGTLYLCSNEYISTVPFSPTSEKDMSSDVIIEEVTVDNDKTYYQPEDPLQIHYNENTLMIRYALIDYEKSNYQFSYRPYPDHPWIVVGDQRNISLSNLEPGSYTIQMRAMGKPGVEKIKELQIVIRSPLWKTPWFIALAAILIGTVIYWQIWKRIRHIRQKANLDKLLSQTEMKALQAQMNPHFIFNSLNSIGEMILNNENKDASNYLSKFARLIRITLDQSSHPTVSLRNTIDYLERYMEMENIRNSGFTHQITVDPKLDIDETTVPPMLIQPFIENALWHGVSAGNKRIHVKIDFAKVNDNLVCTVDDNGIGIHHANQHTQTNGRHKPVGIANIETRVSLLNEKYNLHGHISIVNKKDIAGQTETGTMVTLQLPLDIEEL
jgi:ligand-binding sensor domain-containing protein/two-component sensor histidine kinase